jgi:hypothetical protein
MEWGCLLGATLVSGVTLFAVGTAFHFLVPIVWPGIQQAYRDQRLFRPWTGWTRIYMVIHPWLYGLLFAAAFVGLRAALGPANLSAMQVGLCYGLAVFLVGSLPIFALNFASLQVPAGVMGTWMLQNLCQYAAAGVALGWYVDRAA